MDETKYAVYVIVVEDTVDNDIRIADIYPETMERAAGNIPDTEAAEAAARAVLSASLYDKGIAR